MKILLTDIETFPNLVFSWGLWKQNIGIGQIVDAGYTACWSAKWLGSKEIIYAKHTQEGFLEQIHSLLDEADVVVHYNGKRFDLPTLNKEFVKHGLKPPSPYRQVDLLQVARGQFRFASNKLDYVASFLGLGKKANHKGFKLWIDCMDGDERAWKVMERYNKQDVHLLERLYKKLLPWIPNHPNRSLYGVSERRSCPSCGGTHLTSRGYQITKTGKYQRFQCGGCGSWSRTRFTEPVAKGMLTTI